MSRIGKKVITLPAGVKVTAKGSTVHVEGPKGKLDGILPAGVEVKVTGQQVNVVLTSTERTGGAIHGLARSLLANMIEGVTSTYSKTLEINGVGYRAEVKGASINLTLGFSHPVVFALPKGITAEVDKQTKIVIKGVDKQLVGQVAAQIRAIKPPEPYQGKGIKYADEVIRRKEGKAGAK
ncbi:MAG: 50S ribosomal protein L6 [Deltaproteobacteria bacterium]|nr:50S ribosomal protein L6 [Deltaproteobacteria bacterium]